MHVYPKIRMPKRRGVADEGLGREHERRQANGGVRRQRKPQHKHTHTRQGVARTSHSVTQRLALPTLTPGSKHVPLVGLSVPEVLYNTHQLRQHVAYGHHLRISPLLPAALLPPYPPPSPSSSVATVSHVHTRRRKRRGARRTSYARGKWTGTKERGDKCTTCGAQLFVAIHTRHGSCAPSLHPPLLLHFSPPTAPVRRTRHDGRHAVTHLPPSPACGLDKKKSNNN
jgi:hypothetical protein